jgi:cytochrome c oxidase cbb3-type subunit 4
MTYQDLEPILQYLYLIGLSLSAYALYSYLWYMYKSDKSGKTDYENLANLVLDDNIDSVTINTSIKNKKG